MVGENIFLIDFPLPGPIAQVEAGLNLKDPTKKTIYHSFTLNVSGEYIYCFRCEFLTYYSTGDIIFIKNGKANQATFTESPYQGRIIVSIFDNNLLKVSSPFDQNYNSSMRSGYLTIDSENSKVKWKSGIGSISFKKNLVIGKNTQFKSEVKVLF